MSPNPAVTVLMPVRDAEATLTAAVGSIQEQDWQDLELLVIDDGSADGSLDLVADRARGDARIRLVTMGERAGIVAALNRGLAEARGGLLSRMDADDIAAPERLARQIRFLDAAPAVGVCDSRVEIFRDDGPVAGGFRAYQRWLDGIEHDGDFEREFLVENPVVHPASTARLGLLRRVGGYRDGPFPEDYDLLRDDSLRERIAYHMTCYVKRLQRMEAAARG